MKSVCVLFLTVFIFSLLDPTRAFSQTGGNAVGNGGDIVALEFIETAKHALKHIDPAQLSSELYEVYNFVLEHFDSIQVQSVDQALLPGREVDAINIPVLKVIQVSRSRWSFFKNEPIKMRCMLVLHEYLSVLNYEDPNYELSTMLVSPFTFPEMEDIYLSPTYQAPPISLLIQNPKPFLLSIQLEGQSKLLEEQYFECSLDHRPYKPCEFPFEFSVVNQSIIFLSVRKVKFSNPVTISNEYKSVIRLNRLTSHEKPQLQN